jgi:RNA polymerase sigma-70 factor (ECF subfamily)
MKLFVKNIGIAIQPTNGISANVTWIGARCSKWRRRFLRVRWPESVFRRAYHDPSAASRVSSNGKELKHNRWLERPLGFSDSDVPTSGSRRAVVSATRVPSTGHGPRSIRSGEMMTEEQPERADDLRSTEGPGPEHAGETERLLGLAASGDATARQGLLDRHRARLRRMVVVRLDRRLASRVDPSDVVQESLVEAHQQFSDFLLRRPLPFAAWLRQLAWERILKLHRHHIGAKKRSVGREQQWPADLPDESAQLLAGRLAASGTSPSRRVIREELRDRVRAALGQLAPNDREILVMRVLEHLSAREIAGILGITERAAKARQTRALKRLRDLLDHEHGEDIR